MRANGINFLVTKDFMEYSELQIKVGIVFQHTTLTLALLVRSSKVIEEKLESFKSKNFFYYGYLIIKSKESRLFLSYVRYVHNCFRKQNSNYKFIRNEKSRQLLNFFKRFTWIRKFWESL